MSEIRVRNDTGALLDEVRLTLAGSPQPLVLGPLPPGSVSDWQPVPAVQRYPAVEASGRGTELVHLPYDGEDQPTLTEVGTPTRCASSRTGSWWTWCRIPVDPRPPETIPG